MLTDMADDVRAVLFDFDGTLGYYRPTHLELYVTAAAERGVRADLDALRDAVDAGWQPWETQYGVDHSAHSLSEAAFGAIRALLHLGRYEAAGVHGDAAVMQAIVDDLVRLEADPQHFALYEDTVPALERVRAAGLRSYIVSNHIWRLPEAIDALGLGALVEGVLTSARVGYRKPHPEIFRQAAMMANEEPAHLLYVGDNVAHDVRGAEAAGMRAVLIDRAGEASPAARREASADMVVIHSLMEVPLW